MQVVSAAAGTGSLFDAGNLIALMALFLSGGSIFGVVVQVWGKKLKTPADRQSEIEFGTKVLQEALADSRADKKQNDETIAVLREYVSKLEAAGREDWNRQQADQKLISDLQRTINDLEQRNQDKDRRIRSLEDRQAKLAGKITRGEPIGMTDILGDTGPIQIVAPTPAT